MIEAFESASKIFVYRVYDVLKIHRQTAGNYLGSNGLRIGRDYVRNRRFGEGYVSYNKDVYSFKRETDAVAFKLWIPVSPPVVQTEDVSAYYCPYIPLTITITVNYDNNNDI